MFALMESHKVEWLEMTLNCIRSNHGPPMGDIQLFKYKR